MAILKGDKADFKAELLETKKGKLEGRQEWTCGTGLESETSVCTRV